jgi:hypothetical protein
MDLNGAANPLCRDGWQKKNIKTTEKRLAKPTI